MVATQDDSGNEHSNKDYISSESKKRANAAVHASQITPSTNISKEDQKVIIPVPDHTGSYNDPQDLKGSSWDDSEMKSYLSTQQHLYSAIGAEVSREQKFDSDKVNVDSLFFADRKRDKVIVPVPYKVLEDRKANDWDEKIIIPTSAHGSESTDPRLRAEQHREVKQGIQKLIMPINYSNVSDKDLQSAVQAKSETLGKYDEKSKSTAQAIHGVLTENGVAQEISPSDRKKLFGDPRMTVLSLSEIEQQTENIKKYLDEQKHEEMLPKDKVDTVVQSKSETIEKHDDESKSPAQAIHGVLKDSGKPQEISVSDRKQLFGDPRLTVLTSDEIEQQTGDIKNYLNEQKHEEMPSKSSALASGPHLSEKQTKKQKIVTDAKPQQPTDNEGMQQSDGLKSLKKGAKSVKKIVSSLVGDKFKDSHDVKKEAFDKSTEQASNLKENVQKTSVTQFIYDKKYKAAEKPTNNETQDLDLSNKELADKASLLHSKQAHSISAVDKSNIEIKTVKPLESLEKKEKGKASVKKDDSVKYVVSEGKLDSEIQRKLLENSVKRKVTSQVKPKSKISDIKRIYRDEGSFDKEQQGKMMDDNVSAIEKYLQQEISKVSPEKVKGNITEPKKAGDSHTGKNSKILAKTEADLKIIPSKHSREQKVDKLKNIHQKKYDNKQPDTSSNATDIPTKQQEMKEAKDAVSKPIKEGSVRDQQKKPPKETSSGKLAKPDKQSSFDKYSTVKNEPDMHSSFDKYSIGENDPNMHSPLDKNSTGENEPNTNLSYDKYSRGKNEPNTHSSSDKYSTGKNESTEVLHETHNTYFKGGSARTSHSQNPDHTNLTDFVSHYSVTDTKLDHHKFHNQSSKTISQSQEANLTETNTRQSITSPSITLLDSPPRYMLRDIKESEVTKPGNDRLNTGITQNTPWPVHQLSTVNSKCLGKPMRPSSWGDSGTFLPWVSYVAQKKNNKNNLDAEKSERHGNLHVNGYGPENPFWQYLGRQYAWFKDNFNNHTNHGRANVAKATLLAVGLFAMWQIFKPKSHHQLIYQKCSECGSVTPMDNKR
ncbi:uncharacterized protein LOC126284864 [Schistocerca gregaria]|uniref:uncharacterized protein LOC126284864 n=1 Tax=Schistocerca gregaria TaxID=7010 RepID=UPI00211E586F|nr:uncharacterized protein LOC126284864 [Schistocerca gregaria]